jgi:hypothetical protein
LWAAKTARLDGAYIACYACSAAQLLFSFVDTYLLDHNKIPSHDLSPACFMMLFDGVQEASRKFIVPVAGCGDDAELCGMLVPPPTEPDDAILSGGASKRAGRWPKLPRFKRRPGNTRFLVAYGSSE